MKAQFGEFTLDSSSRQLLRARDPVHLSRKAFDALCVLIERRPNAVTKEELHARLWPGTFVVDANLSVVMAEVRRALGDDPHAPRFIRTVHRIGYAFCAESLDFGSPAAHGAAHTAWLVWNERVMPLRPGENLIGREPGCAIWLDVSGVSRRHARLHVYADVATIEDLGSKNGTTVGELRVTDPHRLADGAAIRVGPVELTFRTASGSRATETVRLGKKR